MRLCWKVDPQRGEANFDIDQDNLDSQIPHLFPEMDKPQKLNLFQEKIEAEILRGEITSDKAVFIASLDEGMLPKHGREVLRSLIRKGKVRVLGGGRPRVSIHGFFEARELEVVCNGTV